MPEFADRAEAAEKAKDERLAPAVEAAMAKVPALRSAPEDYSIAGILKQMAKSSANESMEELNEQMAQDRAQGKPLKIPGVFD
jgi:hypothetical protein